MVTGVDEAEEPQSHCDTIRGSGQDEAESEPRHLAVRSWDDTKKGRK